MSSIVTIHPKGNVTNTQSSELGQITWSENDSQNPPIGHVSLDSWDVKPTPQKGFTKLCPGLVNLRSFHDNEQLLP